MTHLRITAAKAQYMKMSGRKQFAFFECYQEFLRAEVSGDTTLVKHRKSHPVKENASTFIDTQDEN